MTVSKSNNDYVPNITKYALKGYDLVIAVGFLEEQAVGQVAKKFPKSKFAIIDDSASVKALKGLKNVEGLLYKEWESGYLVGYLAGLFEKSNAKGLNSANVVSTVGGIAIPPVDHYIAGFQAGAKAADPGVKLLNGYSGDFVAQDKCQGLAQQQIAQGSDIIFQVAGQCGLGAINAARDKGLWGIGVDTNQALQVGSKQLLASATKGVDVSVVDVVGQVVNHKFRAAGPPARRQRERRRHPGHQQRRPGRDEGQDRRAARQDEGRQGQDPDRADRQVGMAEDPSSASDHAGSSADLALELRGITKRFGAFVANDAIDLDLREGEVHALLGENGAGKSTLMNVLYGLYRPDEGEIFVRGQHAAITSSADAIRLGIGMVHQHFMLIPVMTVVENIVLGAEPQQHGQLDLETARERVRELSARYGLAVDPDAIIEEIGVGQQQRVEILKALYRDARVLILDEPTAVLTPQEVDELFAVLRALVARHVDHPDHAQAARGARRRRPHLRAAARQEGRHDRSRGRQRAQPRRADGRARRAARRRARRRRTPARGALGARPVGARRPRPRGRARPLDGRCAPARSSASRASTATARAS